MKRSVLRIATGVFIEQPDSHLIAVDGKPQADSLYKFTNVTNGLPACFVTKDFIRMREYIPYGIKLSEFSYEG